MIIVYCVAQSLPLPAVRVVQVALAWRRPFRVLKRKKVRRKYRNIADVQFETILKLELYLVYYISLFSVSLQQRPERLQIHFCKWQHFGYLLLQQYTSIHHIYSFDQRYTYRVLQTIQMKRILFCVLAGWAVLGSTKTGLKFKYEIQIA